MPDPKPVEGRECFELAKAAKTRDGVKDLRVVIAWGPGGKIESITVDHRALTRKGLEALLLLVKHQEAKRR